MKKLFLSIALIGSLMCIPNSSQDQIKDSLGLPGDNFNLYAVLNIFQQCKTLEEFEKKLNSADTKVNNIDLNGDHKIDYIKVVDNMNGTAHDIVLKDEINENETQDVTVIEVQKDANGKVAIQIVGDEELYGKNYIVEPKDQGKNSSTSAGTPNPGYTETKSQTTNSDDGHTTVINNTTNNYYGNENNNPPPMVYRDAPYEAVPVVVYPVDSWFMWDFLFAPTYVVYVSPYRWHYYPTYWEPWEPVYYHQYYSYNYTYYDDRYYERTVVYRAPEANGYFGPRRSRSTTVVKTRTSGGYTSTYARRDLLTKSAATGARVSNNKAVNQQRETRPIQETKQNAREAVQQNNQSKERENVQRNNGNSDKPVQQRNNNVNEERGNQQRNNNNAAEGRNNQQRNTQSNEGRNSNRSEPRQAPREERRPPKPESKPAPQQKRAPEEKRK